MKKVVGIRFKKTCKIYYFDPLDIEFVSGDHVIVETARGMEYGTVSIGTREIPEEQIKAPLKPILRKATPEDEETVIQNQV
ncbi:MAG: stage 0 sporulation family protein, partial [Acidaminococcaceae bacterium]|nr:stage 0 sporulation family protein [Acidaminococcaceae bacterium]